MKRFNLDIPKMGYILAIRKLDKEFFGDKIEMVQRSRGYSEEDSKYTHVEISGGGADSMRIQPPRAKPIEIDTFYKGRYVKILRYKSDFYQAKLRYKIAYKYALLCNKKYDKLGILAFILPFIKQCKSEYFCSEGVCTSFQHYIPEAFDGIKPSNCFPSTIVSSPEVEVVWEGVIS